jgi:hypothetical protein
MWWLSFLDGGVVIIQASSLIHARMLAAQHGLGWTLYFANGHFINPERAALIPDDSIGRMLSPDEAGQLRDVLTHDPPEYSTDPTGEPGPTSASSAWVKDRPKRA